MKITDFIKRKMVAANVAMDALVSCIGANAEPLPEDAGDGWIKLAPYGEFPIAVGNQTLVQRFELANAQAMVDSFGSLVARAGRFFRGLPIYVGHPDVDRKNYPDERRLGKIVDLEAREDGLYGKPAWNALGRDNLAEGYWVFPSPAWYYRKPAPGQKVIVPDELKSVGLTNSPNIAESEPVTANAEDQTQDGKTQDTRGDGDAGDFEKEQNNEEQPMKLKPETMALLGITEQSTPDETAAAVEAFVADTTAKKSEMETSKTEIELEAENARKEKDAAMAACNAAKAAHADDLVAVAVNSGKCTKAEADVIRPMFDADFDAAKEKLAAMNGKVLHTEPLDIGGRRVAINTAAQRQAVIAEAVAERMAEKGCSYDVAWNAVKKDPKYTQLFAAMQKPE